MTLTIRAKGRGMAHTCANAVFSPQSFNFLTVSQTGAEALCTNICQFVILHTIKQKKKQHTFRIDLSPLIYLQISLTIHLQQTSTSI